MRVTPLKTVAPGETEVMGRQLKNRFLSHPQIDAPLIPEHDLKHVVLFTPASPMCAAA